MKSMRKSLAFLVVLAMVITTVAPVFAATPADVAGTDFESAVGNLAALNIVSGDKETGNFRPNDNITRAEFARIACSMLGMEAAAALAKGPTKFKDVAASHWASGYINVAAEKGIIKGYPGGLFKPDENVTYAEAITVLVRALGMGDFVDKQGGTWPGNYLSAGSIAGITSGISSFAGDAKAIRGTIGQLTWNTLEAEKWGAKEYSMSGIVYGPLDKSLLEEQYKDYVFKDSDDKYVTKFFTDVKVIGTQVAGGCDADEIELDINGKSSMKKMFDTTANTKKVEVKAAGIDLNSLFGKKVDLFFGKDNKVVNIRVASKDLVEGIVDKFNTTDKKVELKDGKKYAVKDTAKIYVDTVEFTKTTFFSTAVPAIADSKAKVSIVLDSGSVDTMSVFVADVITPLTGIDEMKQFVVKEIKDGDVKNVGTSSSTQFDIDDATSDLDKCVIIKNGKAATKDDIKAGNAVTYVKNTNGLYYIVVTDNVVKGKLTKAVSDKDGKSAVERKKLTLDSKEYTMPYVGSALMTKNGSLDNNDVKAIENMGDFVGKDVSLTLNDVDEVLFVNGNVKASASMQVGVVTKKMTEGSTDYNLKVLTPDGTEKGFVVTGDEFRVVTGSTLDSYTEVDLDAEIDAADGSKKLKAGVIVAYDVSAEGKIDSDDLYVISDTVSDSDEDVYVTKVTAPTAITVKDVTKKITYGGTTYVGNSLTTYLNMNAEFVENIKGWGNLVTDDYDTVADAANTLLDNGVFYIVCDEDEIIKSLIVSVADGNADGDADYLGSDYSFGIYVEDTQKSDNKKYITLNINGKETEYKVSGTVYGGFEKGDLVRFKTNGSGDFISTGASNMRADQDYIQDLSDSSVTKDVYYVDDLIDNTTIKFKAAAQHFGENDAMLASDTKVTLASDAVVYDVSDIDKNGIKIVSLSDIEGRYVVVDDYSTDDGVYSVVIICDK